jgi:outer membrane protein assembly factor BamB
LRSARLTLLVALIVGTAFVPASAGPSAASITLKPTAGPPTTMVTVDGATFGPTEPISITLAGHVIGSATTDGNGAFSAMVKIPRPVHPGSRIVEAIGGTSGLTASATFLVRTDWPHFRYDQTHTGVNPFENVLNVRNVSRMRLDWQAQLGRPVYSSSPAVVNGVVYIGSSDGALWAYDAHGCGGELCTVPLWKGYGGPQILTSPAVADGVVYVGSQATPNSNDGRLSAYAADGCGQAQCAPLWQGNAGPESILDSSPAVSNGVVYVGSYDGKLYSFAVGGCGKALCQPLWVGPTGDHIESSPTVTNGVAFIGSNDGKLYAFDAAGCGQASCPPLWTGDAGGPIFSSSPAVAKGMVFVASDHYLSAFKAAGCGRGSCTTQWQGTYQGSFFGGSPAIYRGKVYIGLEDDLGVFDASGCGQAQCAPLWLGFGAGEQAAVLSSPAIANGVVYVGRNTAEVLAFDATGCGQFICDELWSGSTQDQIVDSSPTVVDGVLYIGSADKFQPESTSGRLYVFDLP